MSRARLSLLALVSAAAVAAIAVLFYGWQDTQNQISALDEGVAALRATAESQPEAQEWIVLSRTRFVPQAFGLDACITYTSPRGPQQRCQLARVAGAGPVSDLDLGGIRPCWEGARIGEPLPACWR